MTFTKKCIVFCALFGTSMLGVPAMAQKTSGSPVVSIDKNKRDNTPVSVVFNRRSGYKASDAAQVFRQYLELTAGVDEMRFRSMDRASSDVSIARYDQYFKGVKVEHGNYIIASKNDVMSYMSGNFYRISGSLAITPLLSEANALAKALAFTNAKQYMWEVPGGDDILKEELNDPTATYKPQGTLVFVEDYMQGDEPDGHLHLAWKFDVYAAQPMSRNAIYIDATNGKLLFVDAIMKHILAKGGSLYSDTVSFQAKTNANDYTLHDSTRGSGINTYSLNNATTVNSGTRVEVSSTTTVFATDPAVDAHWGATKVYDYWFTKRNRLSWNNNNGALNSYVNYGTAYSNASWNGSYMVYGDGGGGYTPFTALDITGHEIGHGVCQSTAGLVYNRESGAMNEGFSDIWGACIESFADPHEVDARAKSTWEVGEEIANNPLRSMANPKLYGDPDTYGGINWKPASASCIPNSNTNDNCGVHSNSGVLNKWFYLLTVGGAGVNDLGNAYAVPGIGIDTAGMIAYGTELSLTATANYAAARNASINYATTQFGACSRFTEAVTRAWYAVGVGSNYSPCTAQVSFNESVININEGIGAPDCLSTHVVNIPLVVNGPAPTGGNAVATVTVTGGTAVNGVHFQLPVTTITFPAGSNATQNIPVTIFDNGNVRDTGLYFDLAVSIAANGSNAAAASVLLQTRVNILENDFEPAAGSAGERSIAGISSATADSTSPFLSKFAQAHSQYIISASELIAAGIKPNASLTRMKFFVSAKRSTQPYNDYTIRMGNTTVNYFTNAFLTGLTQVYNGNLTTTGGYNLLPFTTPFIWDGSSNVVVDICFSNATNAPAGNDLVIGRLGSTLKTVYVGDNGSGGGCTLPFNPANIVSTRPYFTFLQEVNNTNIATNTSATRSWQVSAGKEAYFYNDPDTAAIAGLVAGTSDLGCVTAAVTGAGNGFTRAAFAAVNRSLKEVTLSAAGIDTVENDAIIYLTSAELASVDTSNLYLVKTTAATDAAMNNGNTQYQPLSNFIQGNTFRGFKAHFTGLGRYFIVDGFPSLGVSTLGGGQGIHVVNNPFQNNITLATNLQKATEAGIRLYDVTGKVVYQSSSLLPMGANKTTIHLGDQSLVPGNYILQVVFSDQIFTAKLVHQ